VQDVRGEARRGLGAIGGREEGKRGWGGGVNRCYRLSWREKRKREENGCRGKGAGREGAGGEGGKIDGGGRQRGK